MSWASVLILPVLLTALGKGWKYILETSEDLNLIRVLEPWYWFLFLNLVLSLITSYYDYQFIYVGFLFQVALCAWFSISMSWIVKICPHKKAIQYHSWFQKGRQARFCYRCGTRLPKDHHGVVMNVMSWEIYIFQIPPHLFKYVIFWIIQSVMGLISLFLILRLAKRPETQISISLISILIVIFGPPIIYYFGRFRKYFSENKGLIWWDDFKNSFIFWGVFSAFLWVLWKCFKT